ncbi:hypothetical protein ACIBI4_13995 [Streptomyces sp. NPDC050418]|uniref:hypothetical protein n=1 Tax=Streptomyces sp. NPDC050418 TaxID=3365612 RepID=UPI0037B38996
MIVRAMCMNDGPFTARDLAVETGVPADKCQLVLAFWRNCGLLEQVPGRGTYRASTKARATARAWRAGDAEGLLAIRNLLRPQWFAKSLRTRLAAGPGVRAGLVTKLMQLAQVDERYRLEVETLLDLLAAVGMLVPRGNGYLAWFEEQKASPTPTAVPAGDVEASVAGETAEPTPAAQSADSIPMPRTPVDAAPASSGVEDLMALLSQPLQLADLARLSSKDLLDLHGHIAGLAHTASKLRSRRSH